MDQEGADCDRPERDRVSVTALTGNGRVDFAPIAAAAACSESAGKRPVCGDQAKPALTGSQVLLEARATKSGVGERPRHGQQHGFLGAAICPILGRVQPKGETCNRSVSPRRIDANLAAHFTCRGRGPQPPPASPSEAPGGINSPVGCDFLG